MPGSEPRVGQAPAGRRRGRLIAGVLVMLVLAGVLLGLGSIDRRIEARARRGLEARLSEALGGQVRIGALDLSLWRLRAQLANVRILVPAPGARPLRAGFRRGRVRLSWTALPSLAAGRLRIGEVQLEEPFVEVTQSFLAARVRRPRRARPLAWRIDQLKVRGGRFRYEDRDVPMEFTATDVDLHGAWAAYRHAVVGELGLTAQLTRAPFARPYPVTIRTGFRARGETIELFGLRAKGPGVEASLTGHLLLLEDLAIAGEGRIASDLAVLRPWLAKGFPAMAGTAEGDLVLHATGGRTHLRGPVSGREIVFGPLRAARFEAQAHIEPGHVSLARLDARAYGGSLSGRVDVTFAGGVRFAADLAGRRLAATRLLELASLPLPMAASVDAELRIEGEPGEVATWHGAGSVVAAPVPAHPGGVAVGAAGGFRLDRGRLRVQDARVEAAAATFRMNLDVDVGSPRRTGVIVLDGATRSAGTTQAAVLLVLGALGIEAGDPLRDPLTGVGPVHARIALGGAPEVDVALDLTDGSWGETTFRRATMDVGLRGSRLDLRAITIDGAEGSFAGRLAFATEPFRLEGLDVRLTTLPSHLALRWLELPVEVGGRLSGEARLARGPQGLAGEGRLVLEGATLYGETVDRAEAVFRVERDVWSFRDVRVAGPALQGTGEAEVNPISGRSSVTVQEGAVTLDRLEVLRGRKVQIEGLLMLEGAVRIGPDGPAGELRVRGLEGVVQGVALPPMAGRADLTPQAVVLDLGAPESTEWRLHAIVGWSEEMPVQATLDLDEAGFELVGEGALASWAVLTGQVRVSGPLARPEALGVEGLLRDVELRLGTVTLEALEPVAFSVRDGVLSADPILLGGMGSELRGRVRYETGSGRIEAEGHGTLDLGVLAAAVPDVRASGPLVLDVSVGGTLSAPQVAGTLEVRGGRLRMTSFPQALEQVDLRVRMEGAELRLETFEARLGGGEVRGSGRAELLGFLPASYQVEVAGTNVRLSYPEGFAGVYEGSLALGGDAQTATLRGELTLLRGLYNQEIELGTLLGYGVREYSASDVSALPSNVFLDVDVRAEDGVWIRNQMAQVETRLDLHFGGELTRPEITGRAWILEDGTLRFRDVEYRVRQGSLDFLEQDRINPYIDLTAETLVKDYEVVLHIEGTLADFEYQLTSTPSLPQEDIIALLLTGRTLQELTAQGVGAGGAAFTGDLAANYFAGALTERFTRQIEQLLRLERLQIDPLLVQGQADPTARVTVGKQVAQDLLLIYSSDLGAPERQLYQIQWRAGRRFRLTAERDTTGGVGGGVQFTDRFWLRRRDRPERPPQPVPSGASADRAGAPVSAVEVQGGSPAETRILLGRIPLRSGQPYRRARMFDGMDAIRRHYVEQGRIEAAVEASTVPEGDRVRVVYRVRPGPKVAVRLEGVSGRDRRRLRQNLETFWVESLYHEDLWSESADLVRRYYQERGYYAADVQVVVVGTDGAEVRFLVDRGRPVRVGEVRIVGAGEVPEARVLRQMLTRSDTLLRQALLDPKVLDEDVVAIRNLYRDQGYLEVRVEPPRIRLSVRGDEADVTLKIEEGPRYTVGGVEVNPGIPFGAGQVLDWAGLRPGDVYAPSRLMAAESALRGRIDAEGYPDARIATRVESRDHQVWVRFEIVPGDPKRVGSVEIVGNRLTKERIVRQQLLLDTGDTLSRDAMLRSQHRLYRLGIFSSVRFEYTPLSADDPELQRLRVHVDEAPPLGVTVGAGYDTEAGPRGTFAISHANVGGYNRRLAFQARASGLERRVQVVAEEPRLFNRPIQGLANVFWENLEQAGFTVERRSTAVRLEQKFRPQWTRFVRYNYQRVDLTEVDPSLTDALLQQKLENLQLGDVSWSVVRDTRDDPFVATRGTYASAEARVFARPLLSQSSFVKLSLRGSATRTFAGGQQLASALRIGAADPYGATEQVPLSERFFAGGESTLRGFARDEVGPKVVRDDGSLGPSIGGEAVVVFNEEWRFPIWGRLKGVGFYDAGNVYARLRDVDVSDIRHVLGGGLRVETPIGPLRLEYGRKLDRQPGESRGEVFVAIGSAF